jgi:hypothetical protein
MFTPVVLVCALAVGQATEKASETTDLTAKVQALVKQLGAAEMTKREAAEKELIAIGPDVLGLLPATTARTPAEEKVRLSRIRNTLEKAAAEAVTKPALVTLSGEMKASEAIAKISEQTGNKVIDYRERFSEETADPTIKVALDKVPFWQAFDTVLDAANLTTYNYDEEKGALAYTSRGENAPARLGRGSYSGLFRLEPAQIQATRDLKTSQMHAVRLTVDAVWEPRVRPIVLEVPLADLTAVDENGSPIAINTSEGTLEVPVEASGTAAEIDFPLEAPSRGIKKIASLKGKLTAVMLGKIETFEFVDIDKAKSAEQERGGVTVILENCRKNGDIYDVSMRVRFDRAANALESHRGWIYDNESYLVSGKGQRFENAGLEATLVDVNEVGVAYKFNLEGDTPTSYKLVYKTPAAIIRVPVTFEIKDIELP